MLNIKMHILEAPNSDDLDEHPDVFAIVTDEPMRTGQPLKVTMEDSGQQWSETLQTSDETMPVTKQRRERMTVRQKINSQRKTPQRIITERTSTQLLAQSSKRTDIDDQQTTIDDLDDSIYNYAPTVVSPRTNRRKEDLLSKYLQTVGTPLPPQKNDSPRTYMMMFDERGKFQKDIKQKSQKKPGKGLRKTCAAHQISSNI